MKNLTGIERLRILGADRTIILKLIEILSRFRGVTIDGVWIGEWIY
jgi:hypothetical protein